MPVPPLAPTDGKLLFPSPGRVERPRQMPLPSRRRDRSPSTVREWLESPHLSRIVSNVALRHSLSLNELPDLLQEVTLVLVKVGMDHEINATWVFHTAAHKAVDLQRQSRLGSAELAKNQAVAHESQDPELLHLLRARAASLPAAMIDFYVLRHELGLSLRETARHMGVRFSSIRLMDRRCFHFLKDGAHTEQPLHFAEKKYFNFPRTDDPLFPIIRVDNHGEHRRRRILQPSSPDLPPR
jgi:DNA-directed RNA polymerase specialized sigma24 family protein